MGKFVSVNDLMDINDQDALVKMVNQARFNSVNAKKSIRNAKRFYIDRKEIKKLLAAIVVSCALTVGSVGVINTADFIRNMDKVTTNDVSEEISMMIYGNKESANASYYSSITGKNTVYNRGVDENNYYYNHEGIAKDLLKLDGDLFDFAFCSVCTDMGKNINNLVGVGGRSNIDSVIFYLSLYSQSPNSLNEYVSKEFEDVENLNDYLMKHNYIDKNGQPSVEEFRHACDERASIVLASIQEKKEGKGASIV